MPKHIARLVVLMIVFGVSAYAAKQFFTAHSFYQYGHYRGDSVADIAADKPKFKGSDYCKDCHSERYAEWSSGVHHTTDLGKAVQCEVCHGAAGDRDVKGMFEHVSTGVDHPASGKLPVPGDTLKLCPICHEKMAGRPVEQKQIVVATHAGAQQCTACHNPHSPRTMRGPAGHGASGAANKSDSCAGCHGADGTSVNPAWPSLAGQHETYLIDALKAYKSGARENAMMTATAKSLSDADMREIAAHFAALKPKNVAVAKETNAAEGKAKAATCAGCHGSNGVSGNASWPSLAGQQKDYLVSALKAYREGTRKHDVMGGMAKALSDGDIDALATHYSTARSDRPE